MQSTLLLSFVETVDMVDGVSVWRTECDFILERLQDLEDYIVGL